MINLTSLNTPATLIVVVCLLLGISAQSTPASTPETPIVPTGTAQDLENLETNSESEQLWQVGGEAPGNEDNAELDYQIRKSNLWFDSGEVNPSTQPWSNQNSGDSKRKAGRIPLLGF